MIKTSAGLRNLNFCVERKTVGECTGYFCVCARTNVCSAEGPLWVLNLYRWWTHLGTGSHCKTLTEGEAKWVSLWMSGGVCACVCSRLCAVTTTGMKPKPYLTFWLSMPPREPLGLGLQTQNKDKMKTENKSLCFYTPFFYVLSNLFHYYIFLAQGYCSTHFRTRCRLAERRGSVNCVVRLLWSTK